MGSLLSTYSLILYAQPLEAPDAVVTLQRSLLFPRSFTAVMLLSPGFKLCCLIDLPPAPITFFSPFL